LSRELSILISPACAGLNFAVVAFVTLALGFGARFGSARAKLAWLFASGGLAYAATIVVNSSRIVLSVLSAHAAAASFGLSFQSAHRLLGVLVYLVGLLTLCAGVSIWLGSRARASEAIAPATPRPSATSRGVMTLALACYLTVTLIVPLLGGAARSPEFWCHAQVVVIVTGALAALLALLFAAKRRTWDDARHEFRSSEHSQRVTPQQGPAS
jgi:exosortase/archaeosortase family protein